MARQTHETTLGALHLRVTDPSPRDGYRILASLIPVLGQTVVELIMAGGIKDGGEWIPIHSLLIDPDKRTRLAGYLLAASTRVTPEFADQLAEDLLLGRCQVATERDEQGNLLWTDVPDGEAGWTILNGELPSYFALYGAVKYALTAYFFPTSGVGSTGADTSTAGTETAKKS